MNRIRISRPSLSLSALAALFLPAAHAAEPEPEIPDIGADRQLFLDDGLLDPGRCQGVERTLNPPSRIERVLKPDQPFEALGFIFYCSVVDDDGTAMLYHGSYDAEKKRHFELATSRDGLHWERPRLGQQSFEGSAGNNLLPLGAVEASVFLDPNAPAEKRFRLIYSRHWPDPEKAGVYLASSPDGIHWTESDTRLIPFVPDSQHSGFFDQRLGRYAIYTRTWNPARAIARIEAADIESPWPFDASVPPHHIWGKDKIPTLTREFPTVMACDDRDPPGLQLYTNAAMPYPFAPGVYLAFPAAYQTFNGPEWKERAVTGNDGTFDVQFAASRDGITWKRWREPYVPAGYYDGMDLRLVSMGRGMIRRGRELYQYFVGWPYTHGQPGVWERHAKERAKWVKKDLGGIYRATQRVDGFVSMDAGYPGGTITTRPLRFQGDGLRINLHAAGSGGVRVALLDSAGNALPGFGRDDCDWINADDIDHEVSWKSGARLGGLSEKTVRLEFTLRNARLFAFQFVRS